jgi:hypothetical protein
MKSIKLEEYQKHFGIINQQQNMFTNLCSLLRNIIMSEPMLTKREINQRVLDVLLPFNIGQADTTIKTQIDKCLKILKSLQEITELFRETQQSVFITSRPQWIQLDKNNAVLLGNFSDDDLTFQQIDEYDVVRRFIPNEKNMDILWNVPKTEITDFCKGKICEGLEVKTLSDLPTALQNLWDETQCRFREQRDVMLNNDIAVVAGSCGEYFGRYDKLTGRWKKLSDVKNGQIYFGVMTSVHKQKCWMLVEKHSNSRSMRFLQLDGFGQWYWLLLKNEGRKCYRIEKEIIQFTIPLPQTLENWLHLVASNKPQIKYQWRCISNDLNSVIGHILSIFE